MPRFLRICSAGPRRNLDAEPRGDNARPVLEPGPSLQLKGGSRADQPRWLRPPGFSQPDESPGDALLRLEQERHSTWRRCVRYRCLCDPPLATSTTGAKPAHEQHGDALRGRGWRAWRSSVCASGWKPGCPGLPGSERAHLLAVGQPPVTFLNAGLLRRRSVHAATRGPASRPARKAISTTEPQFTSASVNRPPTRYSPVNSPSSWARNRLHPVRPASTSFGLRCSSGRNTVS